MVYEAMSHVTLPRMRELSAALTRTLVAYNERMLRTEKPSYFFSNIQNLLNYTNQVSHRLLGHIGLRDIRFLSWTTAVVNDAGSITTERSQVNTLVQVAAVVDTGWDISVLKC
jgi:hypothetical protein